MALRTKTVEYPFPTNAATLALATRFDFAAITVYLPETTSRTFRSVILEVFARDGATVATSMTSYVIGIKLGAAAFNNATTTTTITNTGENQTWHFRRDVTSYFASNFGSGASQTCQAGIQFGASATSNHHAKLIITYEYDDSAASTRVKTVRIPLESNTGALTTSLASRGTNQVPALDTFLPEASKTYRQVWFEVEGSECTAATTGTSLGLALDAEATDDDAVHENALQSTVWYRRLWVRNDMDTSTAHDFKAKTTSVTGGPYNSLTVTLCVTYEYDHSTTTSVMNSIVVAMPVPRGHAGPNSTNKSRAVRVVTIPEPGTITLAQSGVRLYGNAFTTSTLSVLVGAQAARTYTVFTTNNLTCGDYTVQHRIDSGSASGAALTLARGENSIVLDFYRNTNPLNVGAAYLLLNYTSDVHADGDAVHNHTTWWNILPSQTFSTTDDLSSAVAPNIPETDWYATGIGLEAVTINLSPGNYAAQAVSASGERGGPGLVDLIANVGYNDFEIGVSRFFEPVGDAFQKSSLYRPDDVMALETTRVYKSGSQFMVSCLAMVLTYHAIFDWTVAGTVSGYAGAGSGLTVDVHRVDTNAKVGEVTTTTGGAFTTAWPDDTVDLYCVVREDDTHVGRSANDVPV